MVCTGDNDPRAAPSARPRASLFLDSFCALELTNRWAIDLMVFSCGHSTRVSTAAATVITLLSRLQRGCEAEAQAPSPARLSWKGYTTMSCFPLETWHTRTPTAVNKLRTRLESGVWRRVLAALAYPVASIHYRVRYLPRVWGPRSPSRLCDMH